MLVDQKFRCTACGFIRVEKNFPKMGVPAEGQAVEGMALFQGVCRRCGKNEFVAIERPAAEGAPLRKPEGWKR